MLIYPCEFNPHLFLFGLGRCVVRIGLIELSHFVYGLKDIICVVELE